MGISISSILFYLVAAVFFLVSLVLYVLLTACILPRLLLGYRFSPDNMRDRGVKKYLFENGRAIVCLPDPELRPYIPQYILSDHSGERFLKCMLQSGIFSLHYYVFAFDANDRQIQVLEVKDPVPVPGSSKAVALPLNTAYVTLSLINVNGKKFKNNKFWYPMVKIIAYLASTVALTIAEALMITTGMLYIADLLFDYSQLVSFSYGSTLTTAIILGGVYALIVLRTHMIKGSRICK